MEQPIEIASPVEFIEVDEYGIPQDVHLFVPGVDEIPGNCYPGWGPNRVFQFAVWDFALEDWVEGATQSALLNKAKGNKMYELREKCQSSILGRFTAQVNGIDYGFSCDGEAQSNFEKVDRAFEKGRMTEIGWTAYDAEGKVVRLLLTPETFEPVYVAHLNHIQGNIAKFRDFLQPMVQDALTEEEVFSIEW